MKVLKFGGTSVGSVESILSLKKIVEKSAEECPVIVVVSALGGVTDKLIATARLASKGGDAWRTEFESIYKRHKDMIEAVISDAEKSEALLKEIDTLLEQLRSIYFGVSLVRDLGRKTLDVIVSYGERMSSKIVATLVEGAVWYDSRKFIKTERKAGGFSAGGYHFAVKQGLAADYTYSLVKETFKNLPRIALVPGFISRDKDTDEVTNLGRGGSDYTAAIIAAALDAEVLEIWTDVDGFMTADPRVIPGAFRIDELSYIEAMELCNFGAKVIYPPTIYPVCVKNIPIKVKNTFNPECVGTIIKEKITNDGRPIKGMSSIKGTAIITVTGLSMVGVVGVNQRIFSLLADNGISVYMVSQASSENSTSIGVREEDVDEAEAVLNKEFAKEIETGAMFPMRVIKGLSTIAIVGENMRHKSGTAGKLFSALGKSNISVIACAQGASETNISFTIDAEDLGKALNTIHDSFFGAEYKELNLFVCGVGTVGGALLDQIRLQQNNIFETKRLRLNVIGVANSRKAIVDRAGLDLSDYIEKLSSAEDCRCAEYVESIIKMKPQNGVFVDCTASEEVARLYKELFKCGVSVVAANKIAASGDYEALMELRKTALDHGAKFLFETNVAAGLPVINTIESLVNSGDKVLKIEAVLSGTLNYIFDTLAGGTRFSECVRQAKEQGYSEPDPRIDLSGKDVIRKIVILSRVAGYKISQSDVEKNLFIPAEFFDGDVDEFWKKLPRLDDEFGSGAKRMNEEGKRWKFVAKMENGRASVGLQSVDRSDPFYNLTGSNNMVAITTERYKESPMIIQGYGAGAAVTAAGVFGDILSLACL